MFSFHHHSSSLLVKKKNYVAVCFCYFPQSHSFLFLDFVSIAILMVILPHDDICFFEVLLKVFHLYFCVNFFNVFLLVFKL